MRLENPSARFIDYQLRILGIRVWEQSCQLIAKSGAEWTTLGPRWDLPMNVPHNAEELKAASEEPLRLTAYQYCAEYPGSDLAEMLNKTGDFSAALHSLSKQRDGRARSGYNSPSEERKRMSSNGRHIVVSGTSAGGLEALDDVVGQMQAVCLRRFSSFSIWHPKRPEKRCCISCAGTRLSIAN